MPESHSPGAPENPAPYRRRWSAQHLSSWSSRRSDHRPLDPQVRPTAAKVAAERLSHGIAGRPRLPLEQADRCHDEPGDAVPALHRRFLDKRLLYRVQRPVGPHTFDGGDRSTRDGADVAHTRPQRLAVDKYRARAT